MRKLAARRILLRGPSTSSCFAPRLSQPGFIDSSSRSPAVTQQDHPSLSQAGPHYVPLGGTHVPPVSSVQAYWARDSKSTMGKKKDKLRARQAQAAKQNQPSPSGSASLPGASTQNQAVEASSGNPPGHHQHAGSFTPDQQWPAMDGTMTNNSGWPPFPMAPQMMNGLQGFNMPMFQPNSFNPMQSMPNQGFGMMGTPYGGTAAFSTASPHMFPGQHPQPSTGHYPPDQTAASPELPMRTRSAAKGESRGPGAPAVPLSPQPANKSKQPPKRDAITAPSLASGGIPEPGAAYMVRASFLPKRRATPGPLLVVIDLNGTLLHRPDKRRPFNFRARPHARDFVAYCIETFWVVIWSSARPDNVRRMVAELADPGQLREVVAVWGRDRFGLTPEDYNSRTQCYKRLTALWDDPAVKASYPRHWDGYGGRCWDQGNTVLIDDSVEKARSEPHNAITIPEFTGDMGAAPDILPLVHDYLNELCFQEDVSTYIRANPFKMA